MGKIKQIAVVTNQRHLIAAEEGWIKKSEIKTLEINFLVDTGASMICLPISMINQLQLKKNGERNAQTANGIVIRGVYGPVNINIMDRNAIMEVMELPDDTPPLLGYLPLETLDLYPNPKFSSWIRSSLFYRQRDLACFLRRSAVAHDPETCPQPLSAFSQLLRTVLYRQGVKHRERRTADCRLAP